MLTLKHTPRLLGTLALTAALAGCGSSNDPITSKSATEILAASRTAARDASAVHVLSKLSVGRSTNTLELQLTHQGGRARVQLLGRGSEVIRVDNTLYAKASPAFYRRLAQRTGKHVPPGTWLAVPANGTQLPEFAALTQPGGELTLLLRDPTISLTKGHTLTVNGQTAIELKEKGTLYTGAIYITTTGQPYPIAIVKHGRENGQITFSAWNKPVPLSPPANAVELAKIEKQ